MAKRGRKIYDDDDGRTIANMDLDGMPGYMGFKRRVRSANELKDITKEEERAAIKGILKAVFLIAGVFIAGYTLFLLFCVFVWFK